MEFALFVVIIDRNIYLLLYICMREVLIFTLMLCVALETHSILICLLVGLFFLIGVRFVDRSCSLLLVSMAIVTPLCAVWWYDFRMLSDADLSLSSWTVQEQFRQ